jgi:hypothetical protein
MFRNTICIEIEDLHAGTKTLTGQGTFANYREAAARAEKLNDHYAEAAIPRIASVKGA